jgi:uncharacterized membrane protein YccC
MGLIHVWDEFKRSNRGRTLWVKLDDAEARINELEAALATADAAIAELEAQHERLLQNFDKVRGERLHWEDEVERLQWILNFIRTNRSAQDVRDAEDSYACLQRELAKARAEQWSRDQHREDPDA